MKKTQPRFIQMTLAEAHDIPPHLRSQAKEYFSETDGNSPPQETRPKASSRSNPASRKKTLPEERKPQPTGKVDGEKRENPTEIKEAGEVNAQQDPKVVLGKPQPYKALENTVNLVMRQSQKNNTHPRYIKIARKELISKPKFGEGQLRKHFKKLKEHGYVIGEDTNTQGSVSLYTINYPLLAPFFPKLKERGDFFEAKPSATKEIRTGNTSSTQKKNRHQSGEKLKQPKKRPTSERFVITRLLENPELTQGVLEGSVEQVDAIGREMEKLNPPRTRGRTGFLKTWSEKAAFCLFKHRCNPSDELLGVLTYKQPPECNKMVKQLWPSFTKAANELGVNLVPSRQKLMRNLCDFNQRFHQKLPNLGIVLLAGVETAYRKKSEMSMGGLSKI